MAALLEEDTVLIKPPGPNSEARGCKTTSIISVTSVGEHMPSLIEVGRPRIKVAELMSLCEEFNLKGIPVIMIPAVEFKISAINCAKNDTESKVSEFGNKDEKIYFAHVNLLEDKFSVKPNHENISEDAIGGFGNDLNDNFMKEEVNIDEGNLCTQTPSNVCHSVITSTARMHTHSSIKKSVGSAKYDFASAESIKTDTDCLSSTITNQIGLPTKRTRKASWKKLESLQRTVNLYECSECSKTFSRLSQLKVHAKSHVSKKEEVGKNAEDLSTADPVSLKEKSKFPCTTCGKTFCQMTGHTVVHVKEAKQKISESIDAGKESGCALKENPRDGKNTEDLSPTDDLYVVEEKEGESEIRIASCSSISNIESANAMEVQTSLEILPDNGSIPIPANGLPFEKSMLNKPTKLTCAFRWKCKSSLIARKKHEVKHMLR